MTYEWFNCTNKRKSGRKQMFLRGIAALVFICLSLTLIYNIQIVPALIPFAKAQATSAITLEMQKIIGACVADGKYGDFTTVNYDNNGNVVSLETNTANIAMLSANITEAAINNLCGTDRLKVSIPVGNLTGGAVFTGKGPAININIAVSKKITCGIENEFYESGINQTLHRIVAKVETEVYALVPMSTQTISVVTEYCIAETVIVGEVPDAYTKINRTGEGISESDIDDIYDFGASLE